MIKIKSGIASAINILKLYLCANSVFCRIITPKGILFSTVLPGDLVTSLHTQIKSPDLKLEKLHPFSPQDISREISTLSVGVCRRGITQRVNCGGTLKGHVFPTNHCHLNGYPWECLNRTDSPRVPADEALTNAQIRRKRRGSPKDHPNPRTTISESNQGKGICRNLSKA